ncbi:DUF2142 domain-containing protein [uncultured Enorma sp.]|uniref:DUF2142 domain-containing protein n=1 Tax=uncultured Enorma sp. TaxID=1714346 RepID=UPI0026DA7701|nr:DUF2142 domain-containing protein [uncultured Enorma sp.]
MNISGDGKLQLADEHPSVRKSHIFALLAFMAAALYSLYCFATCRSRVLLVCSLVGSIGIGCLVFLYYRGLINRMSPKKLSLFLAGSCIIFSFAFPPMSVPDETHHYLASYWLADCIQGESSFDNSLGFPVRQDDWQMALEWSSNAITYDSYKNVAAHFQIFSSASSTHEVSGFSFSIGGENVVTKIPTVLAILLGKVMHLGSYPIFYLGRLLNSAFFIALAVAAYCCMPYAKNVIVCISLLPMTLHLAASYSYDSGIIGLALLLLALLCRSIEAKGRLSRGEVVSIVVCAACLAPCKLIYAPICLFAFLIPESRFGSRKEKVVFLITLFVAAIASIALLRLSGVASLASSSNGTDYRGGEEGEFYSLSDALGNPVGTLLLFMRSLFVNGDFYLSTMMGGSLGWFQANIRAPYFFVYIYLVILLMAAQKTATDSFDFSPQFKVVAFVVFLCSLFGSMLSMYLGWTFTTESVIQGVQGRYLLPALSAGLLVLRWKPLSISVNSSGLLAMVTSVLNCLYLTGLITAAFAYPM